jgi:ParB-like chromosome segregation protein Spo0J
MSIANRIVGYENVRVDELLAHPLNARIHSRMQQDALLSIFKSVGIVQNIIVNKKTQHVLDGHLRVALALRENIETLPVTFVDIDEREETAILASLDMIGSMAGTDTEKYNALLKDAADLDDSLKEILAHHQQTLQSLLDDIESDRAVPEPPQKLVVSVECADAEEARNATAALRALGLEPKTRDG